MRSETVTTIVPAPQTAVFEYMSDIEKLPEWATEFARELKRDGEDYKVVNGLGEFYFEIKADPQTGVSTCSPGRPRTKWRFSHSSSGAARRQHRLQLHDVPRARHAR